MGTPLSAAVSGLEVLASRPPPPRPAVPSGASLGAGWLPCRRGLLRFQGTSGKIGEGNGTPLQYSCLENPMDGGAWKAAVHRVTEGRTRLSDFTFTFHFHALEKEMATHCSVLA